MVATPTTVLVSDCCHALVLLNETDESDECMKCGKPCKRDGTLGEYYARLEREKRESVLTLTRENKNDER